MFDAVLHAELSQQGTPSGVSKPLTHVTPPDGAPSAPATRCAIERLASGDPHAMSALIDAYGAMLWSLALRSSYGVRSDAEDAVQEILVDLWRMAPRFDPARGREVVFVSMIARRRLIDRYRSRAMETVDIADLELADEDDVAAGANRDSLLAWVDAGLRSLRDEERRVLRLSFQHELTQSEIAHATGLPLGTVKSLMRRGLAKLRAWLEARDVGVFAN